MEANILRALAELCSYDNRGDGHYHVVTSSCLRVVPSSMSHYKDDKKQNEGMKERQEEGRKEGRTDGQK